MNPYKVIEKKEEISWDTIHDVLLKAHAENISNGINMRTTRLSGSELEERVGDGKCFVAVDKDNNVIATAAVKIKTCHLWFAKGKAVASFMLIAVSPEWRGKGVMRSLNEKLMDYVRQNNLDIIVLDTAERNYKMINMQRNHGFKTVSMFKSPYSKHYSVVMAKWLNPNPFSDNYIKWRFYLQYCRVKLRFHALKKIF